MENRRIKVKLNDMSRIKSFLNVTRGYISDIDIMTDRAVVDAKSALGIYALDLSKDAYVRIISDDIVECRKFEAEMEDFK